ncbi:tetraspanin-8-like [Mugil cephalus]|uniref:tetraspanin-8-like n=1 Tax=Mugil cephalus TaxID=48193 RepID=UPI001FB81FF7|nr:tetraspanin-8-like [Mugil cephalus]
MAQINTCLKLTFIIFNLLFAIIGGIIIGLALMSQVMTNANGGEEMEGRTTGLIVLYIMGFFTMVIASLGAYGAYKESRVCLIVFLVCMVVGSLLMLRAGFSAAITHSQIVPTLESKFHDLVPLDNNGENLKHMMELLQEKAQCCGLFSYSDWKTIPKSCNCESEDQSQCTSPRYDGRYIYKQPCFPIIVHYMLMFSNIGLGVVFTMAALGLLGMVLSSIMIHQLRYRTSPTVMLSVPTIFTASPPKYQELQNPPPY